MKLGKSLALLGSLAATGVAAASLALSRTRTGRGLADRARDALDALARHLRGADAAPTSSEAAAQPPDADASAEHVRVEHEHALEHGAEGRARAVAQSRKPVVPTVAPHATLHPARARRHA